MNQQQLKDNYPYVYNFFSDIPKCIFWDFLHNDNFQLDDSTEKVFRFINLLPTKTVIKEKFRNVKTDEESFLDYLAEISVAYVFKNYYPKFVQTTNTPKPDLKVKIQEIPVYIEVTRASAERSAKEIETQDQLLQNEGKILDVTNPTKGTFKNFLDKLHGKVRQFSDTEDSALKLIALVSDRWSTTNLSYFDDKDRKKDIEEDSNFQTIDGFLIIGERGYRIISLSPKIDEIMELLKNSLDNFIKNDL